jgi:hypothetical protein
LLDLAAKPVAFLLEQPNLAFDLALNESFSDFQEAKLPPNFSFKYLQGRQWHGHPRDKWASTRQGCSVI